MTEIQNCTLQFDEKTVQKSTLVLRKKLSALQFNVPIQDGSIGEASAADIILLLLLHTIDMHYHSADISPPSYQIAHPTRSTPFTHH